MADKEPTHPSDEPTALPKDNRAFPKNQQKRPNHRNRPQPYSKPIEGNGSPRPGERRGGPPRFEKKAQPILNAIPLLTAFAHVFTSTSGIAPLVDSISGYFRTKDQQLARLLPSSLLIYITQVCTFARLTRLRNSALGLSTPDDNILIESTRNIMLPDLVCKYIESFGFVTTPNGIVTAPLTFGSLEEYLLSPENVPLAHRLPAREYYSDPREILPGPNGLDQAIENIYNEVLRQPRPPRLPVNHTWGFRPDILQFYNQNSRMERAGITFRQVNWIEQSGKICALAGFHSVNDGVRPPTFSAETAITMSDGDAKLGACFRFRRSDANTWIPSRGNDAIRGIFFSSTVFEEPSSYLLSQVRESP